MIEKYVNKAWELLQEFNRITPLLIARKFKLDIHFAQKVCHQVWLRQHKEARKSADELDFDWPAQLDKVKVKNLEKFKGNRKKS